MERETYLYVCESGRQMNTVLDYWHFLKEGLTVQSFDFLGEQIVMAPVPQPGKTGLPGPLAGLLTRFYYKRLQAELWDILLSGQNTSLHPAFCSPVIYAGFCHVKQMERELWLTTDFPNQLVLAALSWFLKKECTFLRKTKLFIVCGDEIPVHKLLEPYCDRLNDLELYAGDRSLYEAFEQTMFEEYGLAVGFTTQPKRGCHADILINLSSAVRYEADDLKKGCLYFDAFGKEKAEPSIHKRRDILYRSTAWYFRQKKPEF